MMFKRISYRLAMQFTLYVFLFLIITGLIFLAADFGNMRRQLHFKMMRTSDVLMQNIEKASPSEANALMFPPHMRERVRVITPEGDVVYNGGVFVGVPFENAQPFTQAVIEGDTYQLFTRPIVTPAGVKGYMQIADVDRFQADELHSRVLLYLLTSIAISAVTFVVGLLFARHSLQPAEEAMERLEQFTQDASHELRTPIATINSSLDLALKTGKYKERIVSAKQDLKHMSVLVEKLLHLAQLDRLLYEPQTFDLSSLIHDSVESFEPLAQEKGMRIESDIKKSVSVEGDPSLIRQIADNLLSNAIKFSKEKGNILVKLTDKTFSVQDDGMGIPKDALPQIFDRFYQADSSRSEGGFGLGLSLVKRIIELHKWSIDVESKQGKGTTFTVHIAGAKT